jgi:C4-dicarboxylate-binding protein DctP
MRLPGRTLLLATFAVAALGAAGAAAETFTMKLGTATINDPIHAFKLEFAKRLGERTGNQIKGEVFPGSQLGAIPSMIEGLQLGTVEGFFGPPGFFKGIDPAFQVVEAPGLFDSPEHAQAAMSDPSFRDRFMTIARTKGVVGTSLWVYGTSAYATLRPVRRLDDFSGRKFRVLATKLEIDVLSRVGATGVPMPFSEVMPALQQRAVDGSRGTIVVLGGMRFFTITKFITIAGDVYIPVVSFFSAKFLDRLPAELRREVLALSEEMQPWGFSLAMSAEQDGAKLWQTNGAEVISLPADDQAEFLRRARGVADEALASDPTTREFYEILKANARKHRRS